MILHTSSPLDGNQLDLNYGDCRRIKYVFFHVPLRCSLVELVDAGTREKGAHSSECFGNSCYAYYSCLPGLFGKGPLQHTWCSLFWGLMCSNCANYERPAHTSSTSWLFFIVEVPESSEFSVPCLSFHPHAPGCLSSYLVSAHYLWRISALSLSEKMKSFSFPMVLH